MDFSKINSISDLINENEKRENESDVVMNLCKSIFQEDPDVGLNVVIVVLTELLELHSSVMNQAIENGESHVVANWAIDCGRLDDIITTLKGIQI